MSSPEATSSPRIRLSERRRTSPIDATLENLLTVLKAELDLCAQLPIFEYETASDGHNDSATVLHALALSERLNVEKVIATIQRHLAERGNSLQPESPA